MDLTKYQSVKYHEANYNCLHFAVDIYRDLTEQDMGLFVSELMTGKDKRQINVTKLKEFSELPQPIAPCLAIMRGAEVHAGIYHNGVIIHLTDSGIHAQPPHLAELQHGRIKYYRVN